MSKVWVLAHDGKGSGGPAGWPKEVRQQEECPGAEWLEFDLKSYDEYCRKMRPVFDYWVATKDSSAAPEVALHKEVVAAKVEKAAAEKAVDKVLIKKGAKK